MTFNPNDHIIKIKTKRGLQDYLNVQSRMMWFRDLYPHGVILTELAHLDLERQIAVFHAHVDDGQGGIGEGYGSESAKDFDDYIEKASTKAIGRALLALGFGTCFAGEELDEEHRIVDAPVESSKIELLPPSPAQIETIKELALHTGAKIRKPVTFAEAQKAIEDLQAQWDALQAQRKGGDVSQKGHLHGAEGFSLMR